MLLQLKLFILLISAHILNYVICPDYQTEDEITEEIDKMPITYGMVVRIQHQASKYFLHSHDVKYGGGSQQQSITAVENQQDYNSLWTIKEGHDYPMKYYTESLKCNDIIRLEHNLSRKNLHTHNVDSPISGKQEVSGFGNDGNGDTGDNWQIVCDKGTADDKMFGKMEFHLKSLEYQAYLYSNKQFNYNQRNCGNCPILGQLEVAATGDISYLTKWKIHSGLFYKFDGSQDNQHDAEYEDREDAEFRDNDEF